MSAPLPDFRAGEPLTAAALNAIVARVRALLARTPAGAHAVNRPRVPCPGRHFAFEVGELSGVLYYRQGWVDPGTGQLVKVGEREWNPIGRLAPCTVWLEISGSPDACTAAVVCGAYDASTPETALRRRLAYVRADADDEARLYCVQVCGGLICPCTPRRVMGTPIPEQPELFAKVDETWNYRHGGAITGAGYTVGDDEYEPRRVPFGYDCTVRVEGMPPERGGDRFALGMSFACNM